MSRVKIRLRKLEEYKLQADQQLINKEVTRATHRQLLRDFKTLNEDYSALKEAKKLADEALEAAQKDAVHWKSVADGRLDALRNENQPPGGLMPPKTE